MIAFCSRVLATAMLLVLVTGVPVRPAAAASLGTAFTYQGQLQQSGLPASGSCDMQFSLFDAASGTTQIGSTQPVGAVTLTNGLFTLPLDFGSGVFTGAERYLEIKVRCPAGGGNYVTLSPRQHLTAAPYALYAPTAGNLSCSGCVTAGDLASGAVTGSAILDGAIAQSKLAFTPVLSVNANAPLTSSGGQSPSISLTGVVGIANGGTGASTQANARTNLGAAASGNNGDITSLHGITGNIALPDSTATAGNILKGGVPFVHNFGGGTFVGKNAGNLTSLTGFSNAGVGDSALQQNTTGSFNVAVGTSALYSNTTGDYNTAVGFGTLFSNQTYDVKNCLGVGNPNPCCTGVGTGECAGDSNTAVGTQALASNTIGSYNTAVGRDALGSNTTGLGNSAVGLKALNSNSTGAYNTAIGESALTSNTTASHNTAVGDSALFNNQTGYNNTAVGQGALTFNITAHYNTAVGQNALNRNTVSNNTAVGYSALQKNDSGEFNTAVGSSALKSTTIANSNTALGYNALAAMTSGDRNTAVGKGAMELHTDGTENTAVGHGALSLQTGGSRNTAVGEFALRGKTTGNDNIALGNDAGLNLTIGSNNIAIGHPGAAGESNTIRIGNTQTTTYVAGIFEREVVGLPVYVSPNGQLGTTTSSAHFKDDIQDMGDSSSGLLKLRPVRFHYKPEIDPSGLEQYGLVAEEVAKVYPDLVVYDDQGQPQTVRYHFVNAMLLNEVQKQARQIAQLTEQTRHLAEQAREMAQLNKETIDTLTARVAQLETVAEEMLSRGRDRSP